MVHARSGWETKFWESSPNKLQVRRIVNGVEQVLYDSTSDATAFRKFDYVVPHHNVVASDEPKYRACVSMVGNYPSRYAFVALDRAGNAPGGGSCDAAPEGCEGATGRQCADCEIAFTWNATGVSCFMTVGAHEHDTCCVFHPNGKQCGGTENDFSCGPLCCAAEWNQAVADTTNTAGFAKFLNPTTMKYRPYELLNSSDPGKSWSNGNPLTPFKFPAGAKIEHGDAVRGWCASGSFTTINQTYDQCL